MPNAKLSKECIVSMPNEGGSGAKVLEAIAGSGVNVEGLVGYGVSPTQAFLHVLTDNPDGSCAALQGAGLSCECKECVAVELPNEAGAMARTLRKLADAGIDVEHCYGSALGSGQALCVLRTSDNAKAVSLLS